MVLALAQAVAGAAMVMSVASGGPPDLNVRITCHVGRKGTDKTQADREACLKTELSARDEVRQQWSKSPPQVRERCAQEVRIGGVPSYVELIVCLQMYVWSKEATNPSSTTPALRRLPGPVNP